MSHVFISKSSEDDARAKVLAKALEAHGFEVWSDEKIPPGKEYTQVIEDALVYSGCVLVLWSKASVRSKWVKREASKADQFDKLVPVLIDAVGDKIPLEFHLIQAADLARWNGDPMDPEFVSLLDAIQPYLGGSQLFTPEDFARAQKKLAAARALAPDPPERPGPRRFTQRRAVLLGGALVLAVAGWSAASRFLPTSKASSELGGDSTGESRSESPSEKISREVVAGDAVRLLEDDDGLGAGLTYVWRLENPPDDYPVQVGDLAGKDAVFTPAEMADDYELVFELLAADPQIRVLRQVTLTVDCEPRWAPLEPEAEPVALFGTEVASVDGWKGKQGTFVASPDDNAAVMGVALKGRSSTYHRLNRGEWQLSGRMLLGDGSALAGLRLLAHETMLAEVRLERDDDGNVFPRFLWGATGAEAADFDLARYSPTIDQDGYMRFAFRFHSSEKLELMNLGGPLGESKRVARPSRVEIFVEGGKARFAEFELSGL